GSPPYGGPAGNKRTPDRELAAGRSGKAIGFPSPLAVRGKTRRSCMDQKNQDVPSETAKPRVRLPRPQDFDKLKAERIEQPLDAAQVAEKVGSLPGWGVSPKGLSLARRFYFPGEEEARAYSDYLLSMGIGQ